MKHHGDHIIYTDGDEDAPQGARDNNGAVVLAYCAVCGEYEAGLTNPCKPRATHHSYINVNYLSDDKIDAILELIDRKVEPRVKVTHIWQDDSLPCADVIFHTWKLGDIKTSFWNVDYKLIAALHFIDSKVASCYLARYLVSIKEQRKQQ